ncbi:MAG: hypothetical protein QXF83_06125, partial [Candidatus Bathyarchaeia archaeon]
MRIKNLYLIFPFLGLNLLLGLFIILIELHFEFYRFYTPMLMTPILSFKIDFIIWLIYSVIILIIFLVILDRLNKAL